jgi:apolipoprotein N-acyltransferase
MKFAIKKYPMSVNFILGALLVLGFAPINIWPVGLIVPGLLAWLWYHPEPGSAKKGLAQGFAFGLGFFGFGVSWIYVSIATYGNTNVFVAGLVTIMFIMILSLFPALQAYCYQRFFKTHPKINALIMFPGVWVILDFIRGSLFTGFPWLYVGYTQTFTPLSGMAKLLGVYGVTWLCVFVSASVFVFLKHAHKRSKIALIIAIILLIAVSSGLKYYRFTQPISKPLAVLLVQGDIPQPEKWDPKNVPKIILKYTQLTAPHLNTSLIVWPENAITTLPQNITPFLDALDRNTRLLKSAIVFGIPIENTLNGQVYNGALALGDGQGMYLKRHLVPFGEYVPYQNIVGSVFQFLNIPMSDFSKGPDQQYPMMLHGLPVSIFICYESAYPMEVRNHLGRAAYIITLSDDSWFGHSFASSQQEEIDAMRAVETERPILRATNNGITSIIDSNGKIIARAPSFQAAILQGVIQPVTGPTPWLQYGFLVFITGLLLSVVIAIGYARKKKAQ